MSHEVKAGPDDCGECIKRWKAGEPILSLDNEHRRARKEYQVQQREEKARIAHAKEFKARQAAWEIRQFVPDGNYAIYRSGGLRFLNVGQNGFTIRDMVGGGEGGSLRVVAETFTGLAAANVLLAIERSGPKAAARRYSCEIGICFTGGHVLTHPLSRARGVGPVCFSKLAADEQFHVEKEAAFHKFHYNESGKLVRIDRQESWETQIRILSANKKRVIYFLYDQSWNLIYIGKSVNGVQCRLADHWAKDWGIDIKWAVEEQPLPGVSIADLEQELIHALHPGGNLQCRLCPKATIKDYESERWLLRELAQLHRRRSLMREEPEPSER